MSSLTSLRGMMVLLVKHVHLQNDGGAAMRVRQAILAQRTW